MNLFYAETLPEGWKACVLETQLGCLGSQPPAEGTKGPDEHPEVLAMWHLQRPFGVCQPGSWYSHIASKNETGSCTTRSEFRRQEAKWISVPTQSSDHVGLLNSETAEPFRRSLNRKQGKAEGPGWS